MRALSYVLAEDAITDAETGSVTLLNIIEEINVDSFPILVPKLAVYMTLQKETGDQDVNTGQLRFRNNEIEMFNHDMQYSFNGKVRARNIIKLGGLAIMNPGVLVVEFIQDGKSLLEKTIELHASGSATPKVKITPL